MARTYAANEKIRFALVGIGGMGGKGVNVASGEQIVAAADVDVNHAAGSIKNIKSKFPDAKIYDDYRKLFDEQKHLDAVWVATPDHHHFPASVRAIDAGLAVYCEKPLCHDIYEARKLRELAKAKKVATQMGNQGHSSEYYRRLCEYIWAGAIGNVTEVHHWCNRSNGGTGGRPPTLPVPAGMHWDEWIGPAPFRDYHKDLHPHEWHTWHDFGNGSLGNMACHIMDGAFWALKIDHPTSIVVEEMAGGSAERFPTGTRIRWDVPARGAMPPVKIYWWDGTRAGIKSAGSDAEDTADSVSKKARNSPPLVEKLEKAYGRDFGGNGTFYIGDKGIMYTGCYGEGVRIIPEEKHKAFPMPPASIPLIKGGHFGDFIRACKGGPPASAAFDYSARLTEFAHLGCLAIKAGLGKKLELDGKQCTNLPDINRYLTRANRTGWTA